MATLTEAQVQQSLHSQRDEQRLSLFDVSTEGVDTGNRAIVYKNAQGHLMSGLWDERSALAVQNKRPLVMPQYQADIALKNAEIALVDLFIVCAGGSVQED